MNGCVKMKKRDNILRKYLITLAVIFCAFTLAVGLSEADNKTSFMTSGISEQIVSEKQISEFVTEKFKQGKQEVYDTVNEILTNSL